MEGQLRFPIHIFNTGFDKEAKKYLLKTEEFITRYGSPLNTLWFHWKGGPLIDAKNNVCLEGNGYELSLQTCDYQNHAQQWNFKTYTQEYEDLVNSPNPTRNTYYLTRLSAVIKAAKKRNWVRVKNLVADYTRLTKIHEKKNRKKPGI